ncbi:LuxR C-terminal-related transcriptional regulator [Nocardia sp. NPDC056000]|uniref:LuxR C-terminal-related transcriptional regulator n=1 Tax=Nocardia sp. NPDC056000 TaxID=3345674 RepID=UPI0035E3201B
MTAPARASDRPGKTVRRGTPFRPPELGCEPLPRPELFDRLRTTPGPHGGRVVVLSAPAGSGKTVLLTDWIDKRLRHTESEPRIAWLSMSESIDRNLPGRRRAVASALNEIFGIGPLNITTSTSFAAHLVKGLAEHGNAAVLVIDDAHVLTDPQLLTALEYLIAHAPPTLTIVLSGRYEPPLRWHDLHLDGRLDRITGDLLALTRTQVAQLFTGYDCTLTEPELDIAMDLTRGWTALVRIAALEVAAGSRDRVAALTMLANSHALTEFLVTELLRELPERTVEFLVHTSIPKAFSAALAEELLPGRTRETLDDLRRTGFPLECHLEHGQLWFTHHPMVRAYLRSRAQREIDTAELELRTARWLCAAGLPAAALPYLLASSDPEPLRKFLRDNGPGLVFDGSGPWLLDQLDRAGPGISNDPFVWRLRAIDAVGRGEDREALAYLDLIRAQPVSMPSLAPGHWLDALEFAVTIDVILSSGAGTDDLDARVESPATGNLDIDCYLAIQTAGALLLRGRIERGQALLRSGITLAERTGRHRLVMRSLARLAVASVYAGAIGTARVRAERALRYALAHDLHDVSDTEHMRLAVAVTRHIQGEEFDVRALADMAERWWEPARSGLPVTGLPSLVACQFLLSRVATDDYAAAHRARSTLLRLLESDPLPPGNQGIQLPGIVGTLLRLNEVRPARELVDRAQAALGDTAEVVLAQAMLAETARKPRTARILLEPLLDAPHRLYPLTAVWAWLYHARVLHQLDMPTKTADALEAALRISAADTLVSPWLDIPESIGLLDIYAGRFGRLDDFAETLRHHPAALRGTTPPTLTETEMIVLKHLPSRRTAAQIADDLGVSINTVKTHLRGIYTKLDANTRSTAVARARLTGLL